MSVDLEANADLFRDQLLKAREIIIKYKAIKNQMKLISDHIAYLDQLSGELYAITNREDETRD